MQTAASIALISVGLYGLFRRSSVFDDGIVSEAIMRTSAAVCLIVGTLNLMV